MPHQYIQDRSLIRLHGEDTTSFLQNLLTANIEDLDASAVSPCALLTPQGKIAFDFLIGKTGENDYFIDINQDYVEAFKKRIQLYKLRADITLADMTESKIFAIWSEPNHKPSALKDLRFPHTAKVYRHYNGPIATGQEGDFDDLRIQYGIAESDQDYALNDIFPHDIYFDLNGAIDFKKGCYVGQEVISRMQHRGSARKRVCMLRADTEFAATATQGEQNITANGKTIGQLGTVLNSIGLGIIRVDRLIAAQKSDQDIYVGDTKVVISFPEWVGDRYIPIKVEAAI